MKEITKTISVFFLLIGSMTLGAQVSNPGMVEADFVVKTYPLRYVYGVNAAFDFRFRDSWWLSFMYGDYDRSFAFNRILGFPQLVTARGAMSRVTIFYQKPGDLFYQGGYFGVKRIVMDSVKVDVGDLNGFSDSYMSRDQWNTFLGYQLGLRKQTLGLGAEWYFSVGAVYRQIDDVIWEPDNPRSKGFYPDYGWLPHVMTGVAITFGG